MFNTTKINININTELIRKLLTYRGTLMGNAPGLLALAKLQVT